MHKIEGLYIGDITTLEPCGDRTGIFKQAVSEVVIQSNGLVGDHQADRRFHGGPDKAVHQFSRLAYERLAASFPTLSTQFLPGSMGENLSVNEMTDENVFIGDIYRVDKVLIQVSEPRRPCWKINKKFGDGQLSQFVESEALTGWYFRVLEGGTVGVGNMLQLQERHDANPSIAEFSRVARKHRPPLEALKGLIQAPGLSASWQKKLRQRIQFLSND